MGSVIHFRRNEACHALHLDFYPRPGLDEPRPIEDLFTRDEACYAFYFDFYEWPGLDESVESSDPLEDLFTRDEARDDDTFVFYLRPESEDSGPYIVDVLHDDVCKTT